MIAFNNTPVGCLSLLAATLLRAKCIELAKKFVQACPHDGMESPNKLFGQPDKLSAVSRATPWSIITCSIGEDTSVRKSTACPKQQGLWAGACHCLRHPPSSCRCDGKSQSRGGPGLEVVRVDGQGPKKPCYSFPGASLRP